MVSRLGEGDGFGSASSSILNLRADLSRKRSVLGSSTKLKLRLSVSYTSHHRTIRKQARSKTNRLQQDRRLTRLHLDLIHNKIEQAHPATRRRPPPRARGCGPGRGGRGSGARAEASRSKGRRRSRGGGWGARRISLAGSSGALRPKPAARWW